MADLIKQKIQFKGDEKQIKELTSLLEDGDLFNFLRPMPEELNFDTNNNRLVDAVIGRRFRGFRGVWTDLLDFEQDWADKEKEEKPELFQKYKDNYEKHGHCNWYSWRIENWGNKWGAEINRVGKTYFEFSCPWSKSDWVADELLKKFNKITFNYA